MASWSPVSPSGWSTSRTRISLCRGLSRTVRPSTTQLAVRPTEGLDGDGALAERHPQLVGGFTASNRPSSASAIRAAARTIPIVCGEAMSSPPVMSMMPSTAWVAGSWIGAAAHVQGWTERLKCSAARICTGRVEPQRRARVRWCPAFASSHAAPSTKLICSALRRTPGRPHTHSSRPWRRRPPSGCRTPRRRGRARRRATGRRATAGARTGSRPVRNCRPPGERRWRRPRRRPRPIAARTRRPARGRARTPRRSRGTGRGRDGWSARRRCHCPGRSRCDESN